jgi:hypothetical protein
MSPPVPSMSVRDFPLEPISKLFEEHRDAGELHKAEEVGGVVLPAHEEVALPSEGDRTSTTFPAADSTLRNVPRQDPHPFYPVEAGVPLQVKRR